MPPAQPHPPAQRKRVLFVCIGNICRSPMAEVMARAYGSDVLVAYSAGLAPAVTTTPSTRQVLAEKNLDLGDHLPRPLDMIDPSTIDLLVNMSGTRLPASCASLWPRERVIVWDVPDPYGAGMPTYRKVRDQIEMLVMQLILRLRAGKI